MTRYLRKSSDKSMEIGNLLFGHSRGEYKFPDREIEDGDEWLSLLSVLGLDYYGYAGSNNPHQNDRGGYDDGEICVNPYYWGDDDDEAEKPNFLDRKLGLEIRWDKYPFRDAYMNWEMDAPAIRKYFGSLALAKAAKNYRKEWGYES